jgi:hypothetical protein
VRARWSTIACQCGQGPTGDAIDRPLVHRFGADRAVEADRGPVPVQRPPTAVGSTRGARTRRRAAPGQARSPGARTGRRGLRGRCRAPRPTSRSSGTTTRTRRLRSRPRRRGRIGPAPRRTTLYAAAPGLGGTDQMPARRPRVRAPARPLRSHRTRQQVGRSHFLSRRTVNVKR